MTILVILGPSENMGRPGLNGAEAGPKGGKSDDSAESDDSGLSREDEKVTKVRKVTFWRRLRIQVARDVTF